MRKLYIFRANFTKQGAPKNRPSFDGIMIRDNARFNNLSKLFIIYIK